MMTGDLAEEALGATLFIVAMERLSELAAEVQCEGGGEMTPAVHHRAAVIVVGLARRLRAEHIATEITRLRGVSDLVHAVLLISTATSQALTAVGTTGETEIVIGTELGEIEIEIATGTGIEATETEIARGTATAMEGGHGIHQGTDVVVALWTDHDLAADDWRSAQ